MKVTKHGAKSRKLHNEGYPHKVTAKQRGYAGAPIHVRIAELGDIITKLSADSLLR